MTFNKIDVDRRIRLSFDSGVRDVWCPYGALCLKV